MSNTLTIQKLQDGPNNVIIKIDGVVDTSDMAATGQIGASGFTTVIGSKNITFVAGALVPTLGQVVTFSDGVTTFVAGTYITAITDATHITVNNAALATNAAAAITITGAAGNMVLLDPTQLSLMDHMGTACSKFRIDNIVYDVEDLLSVNLFWDATTPAPVWHLVGRGKIEAAKHYAALQNNAGTGVNGRLVMTTQGWSASAVLSFSILLDCNKMSVVPV
jgi:hypothetical protein